MILLNKVYYPIENDERCFEFTHPVKHSDLSQNKIIQFKFNENLIIHGFVGYFRAVLYDEVILSTRPIDHTEGLMSWFPMYFPINVFCLIYLVSFRNQIRRNTRNNIMEGKRLKEGMV